MITKSYTIEITEGRAKLTTSNKNISFNQNDVGTSLLDLFHLLLSSNKRLILNLLS